MDEEIKVWIIVAILAVGISIGAWVFKSSMEARAFNSATGKSVSTWSAMWIELRVQEQAE